MLVAVVVVEFLDGIFFGSNRNNNTCVTQKVVNETHLIFSIFSFLFLYLLRCLVVEFHKEEEEEVQFLVFIGCCQDPSPHANNICPLNFFFFAFCFAVSKLFMLRVYFNEINISSGFIYLFYFFLFHK